MISCPNCGNQNPEPARFCIECGAAFSVVCPQCAAVNPPQAKFCAQCGAQLSAGQAQKSGVALLVQHTGAQPAIRLVESPSPRDDDLPQGERKMVTALFADIKGSM